MDDLTSLLTSNEVKERLNGLRHKAGVEAYADAYTKAMERVQIQDRRRRSLAKRVFAWVVHAKRPLRLTEVEHALATREGKGWLDRGDFVSIETALSVCAGLISSDKKSALHSTGVLSRKLDPMVPH
jgi:hypothetical protein